jgi:hypothetical protein
MSMKAASAKIASAAKAPMAMPAATLAEIFGPCASSVAASAPDLSMAAGGDDEPGVGPADVLSGLSLAFGGDDEPGVGPTNVLSGLSLAFGGDDEPGVGPTNVLSGLSLAFGAEAELPEDMDASGAPLHAAPATSASDPAVDC